MIELLNTKEWIENSGNRNVENSVVALNYVLNYLESQKKIWFWVVCLKNETQIGICGLLYKSYLCHSDLGFAILPQYYRKGCTLNANVCILGLA